MLVSASLNSGELRRYRDLWPAAAHREAGCPETNEHHRPGAGSGTAPVPIPGGWVVMLVMVTRTGDPIVSMQQLVPVKKS